LFFCFIILPLYAGCVSLVEKTGQILDGSAFAERTIALYRTAGMEISVVENRNSEQSIVITMGKYPAMKLRGSLPDETGGFNLVSLENLSSNIHGWNEYTLELFGSGSLVWGETASFVIDEIEPLQILSGRIHRYDTRITGSEALTSLRNRRERITSLTGWMAYNDHFPADRTINEFEKYWKPILFPEIVSKNQRAAGWLHADDQFQRAEDIRWNTDYTERVFPEELIMVRNSGTLLRDWEEALSWIYLEYNWTNITQLLSRQIYLHKIK
jgi:hypothetical protein